MANPNTSTSTSTSDYLALDLGAGERPRAAGQVRRRAAHPRRAPPVPQRPREDARHPPLGRPPALEEMKAAVPQGRRRRGAARRHRHRHLGRRLRPGRPRRHPPGQPRPLPRRPHRRHDGRRLRPDPPRPAVRDLGPPVPAVQHPLPAPGDAAHGFAPARRGRDINRNKMGGVDANDSQVPFSGSSPTRVAAEERPSASATSILPAPCTTWLLVSM